MAKKKKKKQPQDKLTKYIGSNVLDGERCLLSAAMNLVESGEMYKKNNDAEGLLKVSMVWYDLGRTLLGIDDQDEPVRPFGFGVVEGDIHGANKD